MRKVPNRRWTQEEIDYIQDKPPGVTDIQLSIDLNRSLEAVRMKRMYLLRGGCKQQANAIVPGKRKFERWDKEDLEIIINSGRTDEELAIVLGRSENSIRVKRYQLQKEG